MSHRAGREDPQALLGVDEARERILAACKPMATAAVPLLDALGLVLGEDVVAIRDVPPFINAAMDGFACRSQDIAGASRAAPIVLNVGMTILAGDAPGALLEPGFAARIMTGAPMPAGADVVVPFERTESDPGSPGTVWIPRPLPAGENLRLAGEDMQRGARVLHAGALVRPVEIALLASIGRTEIIVHRRPRVAILATGDEVIAPGQTPGPGQIWDSNSAVLAALVLQAGGIPVSLGIARDSEMEIRERLADVPDVDLIVTAGGVSAGDFDLIRDILHRDAAMDFWQVRIKPGRPLAFGVMNGIPLLGLPGSPVAVVVTFLQFVRPAILAMLGQTDLTPPTVEARMLDPVDNSGGRRHYLRVRLTKTAAGYDARLAGVQGAAVLSTLSNADGLLVISELIERVDPGMMLPVELLL